MELIIMNKPNEENIQYVTNSYFFIDFGGGMGGQDTHQPYLQTALCLIMPHTNIVLPSVMWSKRKFTRQKLPKLQTCLNANLISSLLSHYTSYNKVSWRQGKGHLLQLLKQYYMYFFQGYSSLQRSI